MIVKKVVPRLREFSQADRTRPMYIVSDSSRFIWISTKISRSGLRRENSELRRQQQEGMEDHRRRRLSNPFPSIFRTSAWGLSPSSTSLCIGLYVLLKNQWQNIRMIDIKLMSSQIQNFALNFTQVPGVSESPPFFGKRPWSFVVLVQVPPEADHISLQHPPLLRGQTQGQGCTEEENCCQYYGCFERGSLFFFKQSLILHFSSGATCWLGTHSGDSG